MTDDLVEYHRADDSVELIAGPDLRLQSVGDAVVEVSAAVGTARVAIAYVRLAPGERLSRRSPARADA